MNQTDVALAHSADAANVVVFAESHADDAESNDAVQRIRCLPDYQRFHSKIVVHSGKDIPRPLIPGLYPSLPRRWGDRLGCQGAPYLVEPNPFLESRAGWTGRVERLASFMGGCARKPLRQSLRDEAGRGGWPDIRVEDTSSAFIRSLREYDTDAHNALKRHFVIDMLEAKFALCPRGTGPSSFRIFEAMQLGRAPVLIADDWLPPVGPAWSDFLIQVRERDIAQLPCILRELEPEWEVRGALARQAWETYYAPDRLGLTIVRQAAQVLEEWNARRLRSRVYAWMYVSGARRVALMRRRVNQRRSTVMTGPQPAAASSHTIRKAAG